MEGFREQDFVLQNLLKVELRILWLLKKLYPQGSQTSVYLSLTAPAVSVDDGKNVRLLPSFH